MIKLIDGNKVELHALGFGMGDVVLRELLLSRKSLLKFSGDIEVFCLLEDETLRGDSLKLIQQHRNTGLSVDYVLSPPQNLTSNLSAHWNWACDSPCASNAPRTAPCKRAQKSFAPARKNHFHSTG